MQFNDQQKVAIKKWLTVEIYVSTYDKTRYPIIQTLSTYLKSFETKCLIYNSDLQNLHITREKLKKYGITGIELFKMTKLKYLKSKYCLSFRIYLKYFA